MNAILLMSFCLGNIIGPETFRGKDAPNYIPAKITIVVTTAVAIFFTIILRFVLQAENKRRDRKMGELEHKPDQEFLDLTDRENMEFRVRVSFLDLILHGQQSIWNAETDFSTVCTISLLKPESLWTEVL